MSDIEMQYLVKSAREEDSGLKYGIIEVTTICQLRCPGCFMVDRDQLGKGMMSMPQATQVLDLCREYLGGKELESMDILGGEPLLWPHLQNFIEVLMKRGIKPWIFSNMIAITPRMAAWLHEREVYITGKMNIGDPSDPVQIALQSSVLGATPKVAMRMIDAIEIFRAAGYRSPMFRLENLVRRSNISHVPGFYRWCLERSIDPDVELLGCGDGLTQEYWNVGPMPQELAEMICMIQQVRAEFGLEDVEVIMPHIFGPCRFFDSGLYFSTDGNIRACSNSAQMLAHVNDPDPVRKAWNSRLMSCRRQLLQQDMGEPCGSCDRWNRCKGGCRATAEGSGDLFAGYELCPVPYLK